MKNNNGFLRLIFLIIVFVIILLVGILVLLWLRDHQKKSLPVTTTISKTLQQQGISTKVENNINSIN